MSGWWQTAVLDNPILLYEAVPKRLRRLSWRGWAAVLGGAALVGVLLAVCFVPFEHARDDGSVLPFLGYIVLGMWSPVTILVSGLQLSGSIVTERQKRTWDALVLSRLRPLDIVVGKLLGMLLPLWAVGLILLPGIVVLAFGAPVGDSFRALPVPVVFLGTLLLSASFSCLALFCSLVCSTVGSSQVLLLGLGMGALMLAGLPEVAGRYLGWTGPDPYYVLDWFKLILLVTPGFVAGGITVRHFHRLDRRHRH